MTEYRKHQYLLTALDPVHIGTGGYRLGRVDNSIVREPGTGVPKIPGTSLSGAIRQYAAMHVGNPTCAGQGGHCGNCAVCYTFGYVKGGTDEASQVAMSGTVSILDAHIVLFPVYTMMGPVWVTTWERLADAGFSVPDDRQEATLDRVVFTWPRIDPLNLGWLMVEGISATTNPNAPNSWAGAAWTAVTNRMVIVPEALFGQVVNSNLEVRTSVSIDPLTGAAKEGALFTYEAIPRGTYFSALMVQDDYRGSFPVGDGWSKPLDLVKTGLDVAAWLGVGGMGTRGFGRIGAVGSANEFVMGGAG